MIGIKMLVSSIEHSWAADKKKVSQQVEQWLSDQHILRDKCDAAEQQFKSHAVLKTKMRHSHLNLWLDGWSVTHL